MSTSIVKSEQGLEIKLPKGIGNLGEWTDGRLNKAIQEGRRVAGAYQNNYERAAALTGALLREKKNRLGRGNFDPWLEEHFDGGRKTAYRYIKLANEHLPVELLISVTGDTNEGAGEGQDEGQTPPADPPNENEAGAGTDDDQEHEDEHEEQGEQEQDEQPVTLLSQLRRVTVDDIPENELDALEAELVDLLELIRERKAPQAPAPSDDAEDTIDGEGVEITKLTGLKPNQTRVVAETFSTELVETTPTTVAFKMSTPEAVALVAQAISGLNGRGGTKQVLGSVKRRLEKVGA